MNLTPYVTRFPEEHEAALRLMLLEALSEAADEITRELAPGSVELRLRAGEAEFAVSQPAAEPVEAAPEPPEIEEAATARINLRLPERLKEGVEEAAARERLSVNSWLVRAIASALAQGERPRSAKGRIGQSYTGWVR
jgi:predicted HicB family RNase H-like nuclease